MFLPGDTCDVSPAFARTLVTARFASPVEAQGEPAVPSDAPTEEPSVDEPAEDAEDATEVQDESAQAPEERPKKRPRR